MATFFGALIAVTGGLLVLTVPVLFMAWRKGRTGLAIKFLVAALAIGIFFAFAAAGSKKLVDSCAASGGAACFDVGYSGFLFLVVIIYGIASVAATSILARQ